MRADAVAEETSLSATAEPPSIRAMTAIENQQQEDARWAATAPEVQQHVGKFVAVHRKRVVAVGTDHRAVVEQAAAQAQCPWWEPFVELVPRPDFWDTPK
jgi:hypothetical protein